MRFKYTFVSLTFLTVLVISAAACIKWLYYPSSILINEIMPLTRSKVPESYSEQLEFYLIGNFVHHYSRRQAWNADESRIISVEAKIYKSDGVLYAENISITSEAVWSNINPDIVYAVQEYKGIANRFVAWNVNTLEVEVLHTFENMTELTIGKWEGTVSNDDRIVVLYGKESDNHKIVSFDIHHRKILGELKAKNNFNWAGVSQKGEWILVENNDKTEAIPEIVRYSIELTDETVLIQNPNHGDFCVDIHGNEVYAMAGREFSWIELNSGSLSKHSISKDMYGHVSCRALNRPGWAYVSLLEDPGLIGAIPILDGYEFWEPWGRHFSSYSNYASQPKASVSPAGTSVIFTTDMAGAEEPSSYIYKYIPKLRE